jgi:sensor histidine kinase YesM
MKQKNDYLDELQEWQNNQFNPGYYTGGRIPPYLKAKGNPKLSAIFAFFMGFSSLALTVIFLINVFMSKISFEPASLISTICSPVFSFLLSALMFALGFYYIRNKKAKEEMVHRYQMAHKKKKNKHR